MSRWTAMSDIDYWGDEYDRELGPCEECEGCDFCLACGFDRGSCVCQPKVQDLQDDDEDVTDGD